MNYITLINNKIILIKHKSRHLYYNLYFFFQAEDGIRDTSVTGVQTCALPISASWHIYNFSWCNTRACWDADAGPVAQQVRSEERRVGKECRSGWGPDYLKKKGNVYSVGK